MDEKRNEHWRNNGVINRLALTSESNGAPRSGAGTADGTGNGLSPSETASVTKGNTPGNTDFGRKPDFFRT